MQREEGVIDFHQSLAVLKGALENAPRAQIELLAAVDALYEAIETAGDALSDSDVLEAQLLLNHAESILTRYFGM